MVQVPRVVLLMTVSAPSTEVTRQREAQQCKSRYKWISTLDASSKALIPTLAKGCCVVTWTAFDLPMILKIDPMLKEHRPNSDDVNLEELWALPPS